MIAQQTGVAFSVDADAFIAFAHSLPGEIKGSSGQLLGIGDVVDFDICWAYDLADPWGNRYELNCYEYERVKTELIEAASVVPIRYWPRELYAQYRQRTAA